MILKCLVFILFYHTLYAAAIPTAFTMHPVVVAEFNPFDQPTIEVPRSEDEPMKTSLSYEIVPEFNIEYNSDQPTNDAPPVYPVMNAAIPFEFLRAGPLPVNSDNTLGQTIGEAIQPSILIQGPPANPPKPPILSPPYEDLPIPAIQPYPPKPPIMPLPNEAGSIMPPIPPYVGPVLPVMAPSGPIDPPKTPIIEVVIAPNPISLPVQGPIEPPKSPINEGSSIGQPPFTGQGPQSPVALPIMAGLPSVPETVSATKKIDVQTQPEYIKVYPIYYMGYDESSPETDLVFSDTPYETKPAVTDFTELLGTDITNYGEEYQCDETIEEDPCVNYSCVGCVPGPAQDEYVCQSCRYLKANHC